MSLAPITPKQRKKIVEDIGYDEDQMKNKQNQIKEWLAKQPHLPQIPDFMVDKLIYQFLCGTKMSTEKSKQKLDMYFARRHQLPEVFQSLDPTQQDVVDSLDVIRYMLVPELTDEGDRVVIISVNADPAKKLTSRHMLGLNKRIIAITFCRLAFIADFHGKHAIVFDCKGIYLSHVTELNWSMLQRYFLYILEAMPMRVKGIYLINSASYMQTVVNIFKPILPEKIRKRLHIFQGDHTNLYKHMPKRILPSDYGGDAPSIDESNRAWQKTIESFRDAIIEDENRLTDESLRPRDSTDNSGQLYGVNGSFSKLNID